MKNRECLIPQKCTKVYKSTGKYRKIRSLLETSEMLNQRNRRRRAGSGGLCDSNSQLAGIDNVADSDLARPVQRQIDSHEGRLADRAAQLGILREPVSGNENKENMNEKSSCKCRPVTT